MPSFVTIRTFDNYIAANIVKARLEAEDVYCYLKDENSAIIQNPIAVGGIKLQVDVTNQLLAEALLEQIDEEADEEVGTVGFDEEDTDQLDPDNKICIQCGSKNTRQEGFNKIHEVLQSLFMDSRPKQWHCFHCGAKF
jgi:hypothetical protein